MNYSAFLYFRKLVKVTSKAKRLRWLKSVDGSLNTKPWDFWKYISNVKRDDNNAIYMKNNRFLVILT